MTNLREIRLSAVESNPWQPRRTKPGQEEFAELIESIRVRGQLTPVRVREHPTKAGRFQLVDGALRVASLRKLRKKVVLAIIAPMTDSDMRIAAFAQNTFVALSSKDKETFVRDLCVAEFRVDPTQPRRRGRPSEFRITEAAKAIGMSVGRVTRMLQNYEDRELLQARNKSPVSSWDLEIVRPLENLKARIALLEFMDKGTTQDAARDIVRVVATEPLGLQESRVREEVKLQKKARKELLTRRAVAKKARQEKAAMARPDWRVTQAAEEREQAQATQQATREQVIEQVLADAERLERNLSMSIAALEEFFEYNNLRPALQRDAPARKIKAALNKIIDGLLSGPALAEKLKAANTWMEGLR